ncbi:MAG: hypothetical protein BWY73_01538 [candidate division TA06 bacterium ADurb.Bin417]|uniref:Uncharacterized protein n=1 Tax=candidate division TA06 bacterium ADurb.Bin417 TaxID=1852828 RepID=A0A1V5M8X9_UNCT6|nr:MAG: hypothetical protein BWY73_01538 [candidate division TA06 bacterium ADurb.Bin417]
MTGELVARIPATARFQGAGRELAYFNRLEPAAFLRRSQGSAARALRAAGRNLKKVLERKTRGLSIHLDFLDNAAVHFTTMARNFEALELAERVRGGRLEAAAASRRLAKLAEREIKAWEWVREFVDRYGLQNRYWPNELDRRLQLQREWASSARWLKFFREAARSRAGQPGPGAPAR